MTSFQIQADVVTVWLGGIIIGAALGYFLVRNQDIKIDRKNLLIQLPGTWITLSLVLIIFVSKYYFIYQLSVDPQLIKQSAFEFSMLFISGFFTGLFMGRLSFYTHQLQKREPVDLKKEISGVFPETK